MENPNNNNNNVPPYNSHNDHQPYDDHIMIDGHDDVRIPPNNNDDEFMDDVQSWLDAYDMPIQGDDHHQHMVDDSNNNTYDHQNLDQDGAFGFNGGDDGSNWSEHGMMSGHALEDQFPDDNQLSDPNSCSSCQVLRQIVHTDGNRTARFEIHGKVGFISHGIYSNNYEFDDSDTPNPNLIDFSEDNMEYIKGYLEDYLEDYEQKGFILLEDPLSSFYEALCTGFNWRDVNPHFQPIPSNNFFANNTETFDRTETSNRATIPVTTRIFEPGETTNRANAPTTRIFGRGETYRANAPITRIFERGESSRTRIFEQGESSNPVTVPTINEQGQSSNPENAPATTRVFDRGEGFNRATVPTIFEQGSNRENAPATTRIFDQGEGSNRATMPTINEQGQSFNRENAPATTRIFDRGEGSNRATMPTINEQGQSSNRQNAPATTRIFDRGEGFNRATMPTLFEQSQSSSRENAPVATRIIERGGRSDRATVPTIFDQGQSSSRENAPAATRTFERVDRFARATVPAIFVQGESSNREIAPAATEIIEQGERSDRATVPATTRISERGGSFDPATAPPLPTTIFDRDDPFNRPTHGIIIRDVEREENNPDEEEDESEENEAAPGNIRPNRDMKVQRRKVKTMTYPNLARYFNLPVKEATRLLALSATAIKNKLRSFNVPRWPFRKVQSLINKIESMRKKWDESSPVDRLAIEIQIQQLERQLQAVLDGDREALRDLMNQN